MIISQNTNPITTSISNVQNMQINIDEKAFSVLIDKLYSKKPEAIIRELCSNAHDAHVSSGVTKPYKLTLPTVKSNKLIVRDFGNGLSCDDVKYYFGTLFGSKSQNSNDVIGGFGLGAKSPFCLVNSYYIDSYHNNKKHSFIYMREVGGVPKFVHLDTTNSNEESGIEFTIDILESDVYHWNTITGETLQFFDIKPDCNIEINYKNYTNVCGLFDVSYSGLRTSNLYIVMGGVKYPVYDLSSFTKLDNTILKILKSYDVYISVDIGQIDVAPSRENVELTKKTITTINNKIDSINNNIKTIIKECDDYIVDNIGTKPYDKVVGINTLPNMLQRYEFDVFSEDEVTDNPYLLQVYRNVFDLYRNQEYKHNKIHFNKLFRFTRDNDYAFNKKYFFNNLPISLVNPKQRNFIINDTSYSYKHISESIVDCFVIKLNKEFSKTKNVDFILKRLFDYNFGVNNYTLSYASQYSEVKKAKKITTRQKGFIPGVKYFNTDDRVSLEFGVSENIGYVINETYSGNYPSVINTFFKTYYPTHTLLSVTHNAAEKRFNKSNHVNAISEQLYIDTILTNNDFFKKLLNEAIGYRFNSHYSYGYIKLPFMKNALKYINDNQLEVARNRYIVEYTKFINELFKDNDEMLLTDLVSVNSLHRGDPLLYTMRDIRTYNFIVDNIKVKFSDVIDNIKNYINTLPKDDFLNLL